MLYTLSKACNLEYMATSYLTYSQKVVIGGLIENIHQTFARPIVLYKIGQRITIANDPSYNAYYSSQSTPELETVSLETTARIRYLKEEEDFFGLKDGSAATGHQNKIILPAGSVKIKVDQAAKDFLKDAQRVELDGNRYVVVSNGRLIAMFGPDISPFYEFILTPTDE